MRRIPPSEQIRKQLDELLHDGLEGQDNLVGTLVQLGAQLVVQELLERETMISWAVPAASTSSPLRH